MSSKPYPLANPVMTKRSVFWSQYFYFFMSLLVAAVIVYGFSHTIDQNLIHPKIPRPRLLYFHAALFTGWLVFFILQSLLVRTHNVRIHRTIDCRSPTISNASVSLCASMAARRSPTAFVICA